MQIFKRLAVAIGLLLGLSASAFANTPVQVFGTDSTGIQRVIGAVAGSSGLYSLSVSTSGSSGALDVWSKGTTISNAQVTITGVSATAIIASSTTRRAITITNTSTSIAVYLGTSSVGTGTGELLNPGSSFTAVSSAGAAWYAIQASGSPVVSYLAENN